MPQISVEKVSVSSNFKILNEEDSPKGHLIIGGEEKDLVLLRHYYLSAPHKSIFESLKEAIDKFPKATNIEVAIFWQDFIYIANVGSSTSVTRNGKTTEILKTPNGTSKILSGKFTINFPEPKFSSSHLVQALNG